MKKSILLSLLSFCLLTFSTAYSVADIGGVVEVHIVSFKHNMNLQFSIPDKYAKDKNSLNTLMTITLISADNHETINCSQTSNTEFTFPLSHLESQTYYVTVQVGNFVETQKWKY